MMRALTPVAWVFFLALLLAACSETDGPLTGASLQFSISESGTLGYEVDDQSKITVTSRNMRFRNAAGDPGRTLTEYRVAYFDELGQPLPRPEEPEEPEEPVDPEEPEEPEPGEADQGVTASQDDDDPVDGEEGPIVDVGSMNLYVPPGIQCTTPDETLGCRLGDEGWRFAPGPEVVSLQGFQLLPGSVAIAHLAAGAPAGWYALIEFDGVDDAGRSFTTVQYRLTITVPD